MEIKNKDSLEKVINIPGNVLNELSSKIKKKIDKSGLFYRVFFRVKSLESTYQKLQKKDKDGNFKYNDKHKLQDIIGVRVVMYFKDDVELCKKIICREFDVDNISQDENDADTFKPTRLNIVCNIPNDISKLIEQTLFSDFFIDKTFEIQLRTVFSEGWHEVEHDVRYKFLEEWNNEFIDYSRALNGIFATLETCDRAMLDLLQKFSYDKYKANLWEPMIRNKLRIRLSTKPLSDRITDWLDNNHRMAKKILNIDRNDFLEKMAFNKIGMLPKDIDNFVYIINELYLKDESLKTPELIREYCGLIES